MSHPTKREPRICRQRCWKLGPWSPAGLILRDALVESAPWIARRVIGSPPERESRPRAPRPCRRGCRGVVLGKTGGSISDPGSSGRGCNSMHAVRSRSWPRRYRFGVNYIDAADCYAGGSVRDGRGQLPLPVGATATSCGSPPRATPTTPKGFEKHVHTSLPREDLQTDYIDLYLLHALQRPESYLSTTT